jgi:hypothetical protein
MPASIHILTGLILLALHSPLLAANHYIRAGAAGANTGSSWTDAWPSFAAATFVRGDTYYVAGGTYNESPYINVALSGQLWIRIKKANATDNSSDPGYSSSYATTTATIRSLEFDKGYVSLDGVTGSGTSGHGIRILNSSTAANAKVLQLGNGTGPYSISHCNIEGSGFAATANPTTGIYYVNSNFTKGLHVSHCWIHEVTTNGVVFNRLLGTSYSDYGFLFENNVISETGGCLDVDNHGQGMQLGQSSELGFCIIRNNVFRNIVGSGMIVFLTNGNGVNHHDIRIYNNIFYITDLLTYNILSPGVIWAESDRGIYTGRRMDNVLVANNTFYGLGSALVTGVRGSIVLEPPVANNILVNNIWESCRMSGSHLGFVSESNNGYFANNLNVPSGTPKQVNGGATTFVNAASADFRLMPTGYAVGKGRNFPGIFTTDFAGLTRGGVWDLGAHQDRTTVDVAPTNAEVVIKQTP